MRRSLAPSQYKAHTSATNAENKGFDGFDDKNQQIIRRLPLFSFLQIPENLNKQFKIPKGCIITDRYCVLNDNNMNFILCNP
jgi:hypothetical protein